MLKFIKNSVAALVTGLAFVVPTAVLAQTAPAASDLKPINLRFASAPTGSTWYAYSGALRPIILQGLPPGSNVEILSTPMSIANTKLLALKDADIGMSFPPVIAWATEGFGPFGDQGADAAQADDAQLLFQQFGAGVLGALPLAVLQRGAGGGNVAGQGQDVPDGQFSSGDNVRRRRVDHHDAGLRCSLDVHVVQPHTGACNDLQFLGCGNGLGIYLCCGANQDRVNVNNRGQQGCTVGSVCLADFKIRTQRLNGGGRKFLCEEYYWLGGCHR